LYEVIDSVAEPSPLDPEGVEGVAARVREPVVAPRRARGRLLPVGLDEPITAQTAQKRVDRALARDHAVQLGEAAHEIKPVALLVGEQREHAVLQSAAAHLGKQCVLRGYHALQGTGYYLICQ